MSGAPGHNAAHELLADHSAVEMRREEWLERARRTSQPPPVSGRGRLLCSLARRRVSARGRLHVPVARAEAKLRYRSPAVPAQVEQTGHGFRLSLDEPAYGVAPGQTAVLYEDDAVVGSGVVLA